MTESTGGKPLEVALLWASDNTSTERSEDLPWTDGSHKVDKGELFSMRFLLDSYPSLS